MKKNQKILLLTLFTIIIGNSALLTAQKQSFQGYDKVKWHVTPQEVIKKYGELLLIDKKLPFDRITIFKQMNTEKENGVQFKSFSFYSNKLYTVLIQYDLEKITFEEIKKEFLDKYKKPTKDESTEDLTKLYWNINNKTHILLMKQGNILAASFTDDIFTELAAKMLENSGQ